MVDFTRNTQFNDQSSTQSIRWGRGAPVTEMELNELQLVESTQRRKLVKYLYSDGFVGTGTMKFQSDKVIIENEQAVVDGYLIEIDHIEFTPVADTPIYLNVWLEDVTINDVMYKHGNTLGETIPNYIPDEMFNNMELTRRVQLKYDIRSANLGNMIIPIGALHNDFFTFNCPYITPRNIGNKISNIFADAKEWNHLGDDISIPLPNEKMCFVGMIENYFSIPLVNNHSLVDSTIAMQEETDTNSMSVRYEQMSDTADLITVMCGFSDFNKSISGEAFILGMSTLCSGLRTKYPDSRIYFITPPKVASDVVPIDIDDYNSAGMKYIDYIGLTTIVCARYGIPVLDVYNTCGYNPDINTDRNIYTIEGYTPSVLGHLNIAKSLCTQPIKTYDNYTMEYIQRELRTVNALTLQGMSASDFVLASSKGSANGVASLDSSGKIPSAQLPAYVDDVLEYATRSAFPTTGTSGIIYIDISTNITYRWSGTTYSPIGSDLALGETSATAYRGDRGATAYAHSQLTSGNPHGVTKADLGLSNVENKSSATIRGELTKANVTTALGYTPALQAYYRASTAPSAGTFWIDTANGDLLKYYNGSAWVPVVGSWG